MVYSLQFTVYGLQFTVMAYWFYDFLSLCYLTSALKIEYCKLNIEYFFFYFSPSFLL
jgi:hypothetical protein